MAREEAPNQARVETFDSARIAAVIAANIDKLRIPGTLTARPGFRMRDGWLTSEPAIVVTVDSKVREPEHPLPREIDGIAVDVRQASEAKRESVVDPAGFAANHGPYPDLGAVPQFAGEIDLTRPGLTLVEQATDIEPRVKQQLDYEPPAGVALTPVTATTTIHLSASPDSGWSLLRPFLAGTQEALTVGLYDFTSAHILQTVETELAGKTFQLVLDHPAKNPTADQTDEQTVAELKTALSNSLTQAWALERMDPLATAWIFPTAYHIKVAVRDSSAFWLSSGNWNNSNQPDIDPVTKPTDANAARSGDRDWHVVVEQPQLAQTFEAFILNDLRQAADHNAATPSRSSLAARVGSQVMTPPFAQFFPSTSITAEMEIVPLLTPDPGVYASAVKAAILAAKTTLYMQFQYIELPKVANATSQGFVNLVHAVIDRQKAGVDVRIIMSEYEVAGYLEQLQAAGLDVMKSVKIQNNVHNKGIVVDGESVLVSSQNWSTDGTLYNRDAGVIIHNADAAAYFQQIFLHDWEHLALQKVAQD
jgi:hypothetical protein